MENKVKVCVENLNVHYGEKQALFDVCMDINQNEINAKIDQWIDWGSFTFAVPCSLLTAHKLSLPQDQRDELIAEKAKKDILILKKLILNTMISVTVR